MDGADERLPDDPPRAPAIAQNRSAETTAKGAPATTKDGKLLQSLETKIGSSLYDGSVSLNLVGS
jgi:hypothetical protein